MFKEISVSNRYISKRVHRIWQEVDWEICFNQFVPQEKPIILGNHYDTCHEFSRYFDKFQISWVLFESVRWIFIKKI